MAATTREEMYRSMRVERTATLWGETCSGRASPEECIRAGREGRRAAAREGWAEGAVGGGELLC
jgi:hypothetical protein